MRYFHGLIFFGNLSCIEQTAMLRDRLNDACQLVGGLQQGGHPDSEEDALAQETMRTSDQKAVEDIVRDIAAALLGRDITIGERLPYPPVPSNMTPKS